MWTRKELKEKAKAALKKNYWKAVVAGLLMMLLTGSLGFSGNFSVNNNSYDEAYNMDEFIYEENADINSDELSEYIGNTLSETEMAVSIVIFVIAFFIGLLIAIAIAMLIGAFLGNPLIVGVQKFYNHSVETDGDLNQVVSGFTKNYKNTVKVMFFRDLYIILWSLLFVIPGIIKSFEYLMVPYILGDNPDISKEEAFALSKQMMMGHKWDAFVLNLSFLGWILLSVCTLGILHMFYVTPYINYTTAALYRRLSGADKVAEVQA